MSKLDYITGGIVVLCILAIVFLVYKMTNVFKTNEPTDNTESVSGPVETEDDIYNYEADSTSDGEAVNDSTSLPSGTPAETMADEPATEKNVDEAPLAKVQPAVKNEGKFMVLAGAFSKKALAQNQVSRMKKLGYSHARVEIFDRGKFAVVLVDRFDNMVDAESLIKKLREQGIECYIKTKEQSN